MLAIIVSITLLLAGFANLPQTERSGVYISAGIGIEGIAVGYSTKSSVIAKFGDGYGLIEHNKYSWEIRYETGMAFWYRYDDPEEKIFCLGLRPESRAFTARGIVVGRSTLQDVFNAYGPAEFYTTSAEETWFVEYPGIIFHVEHKSTEQLPQTEKLLKRKVIEITVQRESEYIHPSPRLGVFKLDVIDAVQSEDNFRRRIK